MVSREHEAGSSFTQELDPVHGTEMYICCFGTRSAQRTHHFKDDSSTRPAAQQIELLVKQTRCVQKESTLSVVSVKGLAYIKHIRLHECTNPEIRNDFYHHTALVF